MLDLFAGLGGASAPFLAAGWEVVRVELDPALLARGRGPGLLTEVVADLATWSWRGRRPALVWASPPCTEFSREAMPWCRTGQIPSTDLARAALRVVSECRPVHYVVENVRGAIPYLDPIFGRRRQSHGAVFLWGDFPPFEARVAPWKEHLSSSRRAERAKIPAAVADGLRLAVEAALELA